MGRVSDTGNNQALNFAINKAKSKMADLQMQGASLKSVRKPSDNPIDSAQSMIIGSRMNNNDQYIRNSNYALLNLNLTERSLEELSDILNKAKEIAISQSSDFFGDDVRDNVSNEVRQLGNQLMALANKRVGNRFIFSGFQTDKKPFDEAGAYKGDTGHIKVEVSKDFFLPINLNGYEVFYSSEEMDINPPPGPKSIHDAKDIEPQNEPFKLREPASIDESEFKARENVFSIMDSLYTGLKNNETKVIQGLLEKFDDAISRVITMRTRLGSIINSIEQTKATVESDNIDNASRRSELVDADIAELFTDIQRQKDVLETTYKSGQSLMSKTLLDFIG